MALFFWLCFIVPESRSCRVCQCIIPELLRSFCLLLFQEHSQVLLSRLWVPWRRYSSSPVFLSWRRLYRVFGSTWLWFQGASFHDTSWWGSSCWRPINCWKVVSNLHLLIELKFNVLHRVGLCEGGVSDSWWSSSWSIFPFNPIHLADGLVS